MRPALRLYYRRPGGTDGRNTEMKYRIGVSCWWILWRGIIWKIIDKTEYFSSGRREDEIKDWLEKCPERVESFVILDDGDYDWYRHGYDKHLVKTDFCTGGLRQEHVQKAVSILNKKHFWSFFRRRRQKRSGEMDNRSTDQRDDGLL